MVVREHHKDPQLKLKEGLEEASQGVILSLALEE